MFLICLNKLRLKAMFYDYFQGNAEFQPILIMELMIFSVEKKHLSSANSMGLQCLAKIVKGAGANMMECLFTAHI